ncbi:MAG: site-specific integrase [Lachnospiraceae bacterium]|nr:site-specific integrase [Lachnospiraceae bacterium]
MYTYITPDMLSCYITTLKNNGKSANTISSYTRNINKLVLFLDGSELSYKKMADYKDWLKSKGFKRRTVNAYLAAANYFCEVMGWQDMKVPLEQLDYNERHKPMCISLVNYNKLVYTALQNDNERLAMMIQVLCHTDLRFCELGLLTVEALETGVVYVQRKNHEIKIIIPGMILEDLNIYVKHNGIINGVIFRTKNGSLVNRSNFCKDLRKTCVTAGIDENTGSIQHVKNVVMDGYPYYGLRTEI